MTIRAIETMYNGYRFRSRLEARWAVFFDSLGIRYDYESEGFEFSDSGDRYLPDFDLGMAWLEIKGKKPNKRELRVAKQLCQADLDGRNRVFIISGPPGNCEVFMWQFFDFPPDSGAIPITEFLVRDKATNYFLLILYLFLYNIEDFTENLSDNKRKFTHKIDAAIVAARQARFERGATQ